MSEKVAFSANKLAVIDWLATSRYDRHPPTQALLATELGICAKTVERWKKEPEIQEAITARARELLGDNLSEIYAALIREAITGSFQHIKLAFEMAGEYNPREKIEHSGTVIEVQYMKGYANVSPDDWNDERAEKITEILEGARERRDAQGSE